MGMEPFLINPPKNRAARRRRKNKSHHVKGYYPNAGRRRAKRKRRVSAASLAALKRINAARRPKSVRRRRRKAAVKISRKRRAARRRLKNPFGGPLALIGNSPRRRRRHKGHRTRGANPMARHRRSHRRRHRRHALSNPLSIRSLTSVPKDLFSKETAVSGVGLAAGFILPTMALQYVPATWRDTTVKSYAAKVGVVGALAFATGLVSKKYAKLILYGGVASVLVDLFADYHAGKFSGAAPAPQAGTKAWFGPNGMGDTGAYFGNPDGSLGDTIDLGAEQPDGFSS